MTEKTLSDLSHEQYCQLLGDKDVELYRRAVLIVELRAQVEKLTIEIANLRSPYVSRPEFDPPPRK